jgi:hypothetical protein
MVAVVLGRLTASSTGMDMEDLGRAGPSLAIVDAGVELWAGGLLDTGIASELIVSLLMDVVVASTTDGSVKTQVGRDGRSKQDCDVLAVTEGEDMAALCMVYGKNSPWQRSSKHQKQAQYQRCTHPLLLRSSSASLPMRTRYRLE